MAVGSVPAPIFRTGQLVLIKDNDNPLAKEYSGEVTRIVKGWFLPQPGCWFYETNIRYGPSGTISLRIREDMLEPYVPAKPKKVIV